ncbi:hypothetical protein QYF61_017205 [Mycteria americana]|uniref:Uncharacterized protein n=1 Tax=Mycteria americana TaxID=33587 RepID=A0AAN7ML79_MYCAM|nr:hypothetical protein QYF61_017205 [Mycteria americana]
MTQKNSLSHFWYQQRPISARQSRVVGRVTTMTQRNRLASNFINWQIPQTDKLNELASLTNEQRRLGNGAIFQATRHNLSQTCIYIGRAEEERSKKRKGEERRKEKEKVSPPLGPMMTMTDVAILQWWVRVRFPGGGHVFYKLIPASRMAERPPSRPKVAWEEDEASQESSSSLEPDELDMVDPLLRDATWLHLYLKDIQESIDIIQAFVMSPKKEEGRKVEFLQCVCILCGTSRCYGFTERLHVFCQRYKLAENIKVLLEEEPSDQLCTAVRINAMLAIAEMSSVQTVLEGKEKSLLEACFSSVFLLPPKEEMQDLDTYLYFETLNTMDTMLERMVLSFPASRVSEELQNILQMLLNFTHSETVAVRERALGRISTLSYLLATNSTLEDWNKFGSDTYGPLCNADIQIPILGQLLGRLLLFRSSKDETLCQALDALYFLYEFIQKQKSRSVSKDEAQQLHWEPETTSWLYSPTTADFTMEFANYLQPSERTDIVLVAIEAMRDSSIFDKEAARKMLDLVMRNPDFWLADVPKIMKCIHKNLECINRESARQSVQSLLLLLTNRYATQVVVSLLKFSPPGDSPAGSARPAAAKAGQGSPEPPRSSQPHGEHHLSPLLPAQGIPSKGQGLRNAGLSQAMLLWLRQPCSRSALACSTDMAIWEVMLSVPQTLEKILKELLRLLRDQWLRKLLSSITESTCITTLALMASREFQSEDLGDESHVESSQRHPDLVMVSLVLGGLITLSERPDMARKMQVLLPRIMEVLQDGDTDIKTKALVVFRNVMGHLKRKEASPFAVQLVEELLPLFDDESSQLRELSISLFRDLVESVVGSNKKRMKNDMWRVLVPLFLRMSDQTDSVAKASGEALLAAAELLKWKELRHLVQTQQTWRIGECLLERDRSRAEEYLNRSLPYLKDAQATLREAAVRFIGGPAGRLAQSHPPRLLLFPGLSPDEAEEGVQPSRQGRGLCCGERAGEQGV